MIYDGKDAETGVLVFEHVFSRCVELYRNLIGDVLINYDQKATPEIIALKRALMKGLRLCTVPFKDACDYLHKNDVTGDCMQIANMIREKTNK